MGDGCNGRAGGASAKSIETLDSRLPSGNEATIGGTMEIGGFIRFLVNLGEGDRVANVMAGVVPGSVNSPWKVSVIIDHEGK